MTDNNKTFPNKAFSAITPDIYRRFKMAVELRKWPNGEVLSQQQIETCMQAIISYEAANVAPENRTGYVPPKTDPCPDKHEGADANSSTPKSKDDETPIKWQ